MNRQLHGEESENSNSESEKSEELHLENFKQKIIQKYAEIKGKGEEESDEESPKYSDFSEEEESTKGVEDYYNKQKFQRKKSFLSQKTMIEEALVQKVKIMENKNEKHVHLLKSAFLADDVVDKELNEMMLIDGNNDQYSKTLRKQKKENERQEEKFEDQHNRSLLESLESSCDSENERENKLKNQIEALQLMRLKNEDNSFLRIIEMTSLEKLEIYHDTKPLLKCRKSLMKMFFYFTYICETIVKNPLFEFISFSIIIFNTVILAMDDPTDTTGNTLSDKLDSLFLALYSTELILKILGFGNQFFRDFWNIFDFIIVLFSWLDFFLKEFDYKLTALRSLRVLRPLKTISTIKKLKILILTIFASIPFLLEILLILGFVYLMFAIGGLHIFQGVLKKRCFSLETGSMHPDEIICDNNDICPTNFVCGKMFSNPNWGVTNFDNIGSSLLMVFQVTTLEGWFPIMESLISAFSGLIDSIILVYFIMLIFIGNFFILNLTLAVIIVKFNESHESKTKVKQQIKHRLDCECQYSLSFSKMSKCGYFRKLKLKKEIPKKLQNKLINPKKKSSLIKVNREFKFKYKEKKSKLKEEKEFELTNLKKRKINDFVKGIQVQQNTQLRNTFDQKQIDISLNDSNIGKISTFFKSGQQSLINQSQINSQKNQNSDSNNLRPTTIVTNQQSSSSLQNSATHSDVDLLSKLRKSQDYFFNSKSQISEENFVTNDHEVLDNNNIVSKLEESNILEKKPEYNVSESSEDFNVPKISRKTDLKLKPSDRAKELFSKPSNTGFKSRTNSIQLTKTPLGFNNTNSFVWHENQKGKLVSREKIMQMYLKSVRSSEENIKMSKGLMSIQDLKDKNFNKRPLLKRNHTIDKSSLKRKKTLEAIRKDIKPRFTQNKLLEMMNGYNQIVKRANKQLESKKSLTEHSLSELPTKLVSALSKKVRKDMKKKKKRKSHNGNINNVLKRQITAHLNKKYGSDDINEFFDKNNKEGMFVISEDEESQIYTHQSIHQRNSSLKKRSTDFLFPIRQSTNNFKSRRFSGNSNRISTVSNLAKNIKIDEELIKDFENNGLLQFTHEIKELKKQKENEKIKQENDLYLATNKSKLSENMNRSKYSEKSFQDKENVNDSNLERNQLRKMKQKEKKGEGIWLQIKEFQKIAPEHLRLAVEVCHQGNGLAVFDSRFEVIPQNDKQKKKGDVNDAPWKMVYDKSTIKSEYLLKKIKRKEKRKRLKRNKKMQEEAKDKNLNLKSKKTLNKQLYRSLMRDLEEDHKLSGDSMLAKNFRATEKDFFPINFPNINGKKYFSGKGLVAENDQEDKEIKILVEKLRRERAKAAKNFKNCIRNEEAMKKFFHEEFRGYHNEQTELSIEQIERKEARRKQKYQLFYKTLLEKDAENNEIGMFNWSFHDMVNLNRFEEQKVEIILHALRNEKLNIWLSGVKGFIKEIREKMRYILSLKMVENMFFFFVILNTIILAAEGLISPEMEKIGDTINNVITFIFGIEILLKVFAFGFKEFFKDSFNIFDTIVVLLSLVEFILRGQNNVINAIRSVKVFKAFRVLRITRLLRTLRFMKIIINVIVSSLEQFTYIALLLLLFILIFTLVGMQLFGGKFHFLDDYEVKRQNFDNVGDAFLTVFQILTIENWNDVLYLTFRSDQHVIVSTVYLVICIFVGNYIFLNLFLAILLDGFTNLNAIQNYQEIQREDARIDALIKEKIKEIKKAQTELKQKRKKLKNPQFKMISRLKTSTKENRKLIEEVILDSLSEKPKEGSDSKYSSSDSDFFQQKGKSEESADFTSTDDDLIIKKIINNEISTQNDKNKKSQNVCENSLFLFSKSNKFREIIIKIVQNKWFERSILILIFFSSIKLMIDTYDFQENNPKIKQIFEIIDVFFTICFLLECFLKIICYGFILHKNSYLRDPWFCLDFFIVITSLIDLFLKDFNYEYLKILLLLRTLRPLRFLSHYKNLRIVVLALLESIGGLINVLIVILMVWIMFGILGINLLKDKMGYCDLGDNQNYHGINIHQCPERGGVWSTWGWNFDNIFNALVTLFILSSLEGWPNIMFSAIDSDVAENGPTLKANYWIFTYFIIFILVGALFLMNLFVGVIFFQFTAEQDKEKSKSLMFMTEEQEKWMMMQKMIFKAKPNYEVTTKPKTKWRYKLYVIFFSKYFDALMMLCIVLNTFTMGMVYDGMTESYGNIIDGINKFFTILFILEAVFKLLSVGFKYFYSDWNKFDFMVALISLADLIMSDLLNLQSFRIYPQIARVIKILRITRLFKLMKSKKLEGFNKIIRTLVFSFPALFNVLTLLILIYFIFSILGVFIFKETEIGKEIFKDFGVAFLNLFRFSTGEDWHLSMYQLGNTENSVGSRIYFVSFIFFSSFVMINMFVLIIIQQFENFYFNEENPLNRFEDIANEFRMTWVNFTDTESGKRIRQDRLFEFFANLSYPMGYSMIPFEKRKKRIGVYKFSNFAEMELLIKTVDIRKKIAGMNLRVDKDGYVLFGQVLHAAMKNAYGSKILSKSKNAESYRLIKDEELKTLAKILRKHHDFNNEFKQTLSNGMVVTRKKANPFMQMLYLTLVFQSWYKFTLRTMNDKDLVLLENMKNQNIAVRFDNEILRFIDDKINSSRTESDDSSKKQIKEFKNDSKNNFSLVSQKNKSEYLNENSNQ